MTHPDLFEQAVAEAEKKQAGEPVAVEREETPPTSELPQFEGFEVIGHHRGDLPLVKGTTLSEVLAWASNGPHRISERDVSTYEVLWNELLRADTDAFYEERKRSDFVIVVPKQDMTGKRLAEFFSDNGLMPATLRELLSFARIDTPWDWMNSLWALGNHIRLSDGERVPMLSFDARDESWILEQLPFAGPGLFSRACGFLVRVKQPTP